ncbi:MAG: protein kinase [Ktedonobacteraceae bacterium]|nr:protein kinase [Ktedonobacteraceae bacterium]
MANNYSSDDAKNSLPISNSAPAQNGLRPDVPETPQTPSPPALPDTGARGNLRRLAIGTVLSNDRYKIENLIASGGMGAVYRAVDTRFNRPCAVKEMLDEFQAESERAQAVEWFSREATMLLDLNHPCIPRVRDFFVERGKHYLVMDFIDGHTLAEMLELEGNVVGVNGVHGVSEAAARSWARQVCSVLQYLHTQSPPIIFRDLKPSNIMVTKRGEIKLIDFGIARTFQSQRQATIIMTLGYAPPEQLHAMPEPRSDIYALGATIHRLLTRHDAVNNKPNIFSFPPVRSLRPDISIGFEQILTKALAPNVEQRWFSAEEMERALNALPPPVAASLPVTALSGQIGAKGLLPNMAGTPRPALTPNRVVSGSGIGATPAASSPSGQNGASSSSAVATNTGPVGQHIAAALGYLAAVPPQINQAYEAVKWAHGMDPNNALVHKIFGMVFARRTPPQADLALQAYNRSLQLNASDAEAHKLIGDVWFFLRQNPLQAIPAYIQSLRLNVNDFDSHDRLGQCFDKTNQLDSAIREYQEALRLASSQPEIVRLRLQFALGQVALRSNQLSIAEHAFVQVLILNAADHQARFLLSQVYERENKLEEAFTQCTFVVNGPMGTSPAVRQMYTGLKNRLGR